MGTLTEKDGHGNILCHCSRDSYENWIAQAAVKLADIEEAEDEEKVFYSPVRLGQHIWIVNKNVGITEGRITSISFCEGGSAYINYINSNISSILNMENFGKKWFETKEEAEEAFKNKKGPNTRDD